MKRFIIPFIYIVTLFAMSCEHKDLCVHHSHTSKLRIVFDWKNCPEAKPEEMHVWLYPVDIPNTNIQYILPPAGGYIKVPDGEYNIMCYNGYSVSSLVVGGTYNYDTHVGFTNPTSPLYGAPQSWRGSIPRATDAGAERVVMCVDPLWGCNATNVSIYGGNVGYTCYPEEDANKPVEVYNKERTITLYPTDLVCHYSYEILRVTNTKYMTDMRGTISGMAAHYRFADGELGDEPVTLPFGTSWKILKDYPEDTHCYGEFFTFGHHPSNERPHKMMFYIWRPSRDNNGNCTVEVDVTEKVDTAPNPRRVHIIIDSINLESIIYDPETGGNIDADVEPFKEPVNPEDYVVQM